jgi:hypothetical protein
MLTYSTVHQKVKEGTIPSGHGIQTSYKNNMTSHCATVAAFWSTTEKGRFKFEGEYRNDIFRTSQVFCKFFNTMYFTVLNIYVIFKSHTFNMPHLLEELFKNTVQQAQAVSV